jgi:hypothetical protein
MQLRPTWPEPSARPAGCASLAERSNRAAELAAPQATTTMSAVNRCATPATSASTPVNLPPLL